VFQVAQAVEVIKMLLTESAERKRERILKKGSEDCDEEEEELMDDQNLQEEELLDEAASIVTALLKTDAQVFMQHCTPILNIYSAMLQAPDAADRRTALCVFDDIFENAISFSIGFLPQFLPIYLQQAVDVDADVRQAAVYGLGVLAQHGGEAFAPHVLQTAQALIAVISKADSRSDASVMATDNAISALTKVVVFQPNAVNLQELGPMWLSFLPVESDEVEARIVHAHLCTLTEANAPWLLGENYKHVPQLVSIFTKIVDGPLVDEPLQHRVVGQLQRFRAQMPQELLQAAWQSLSEAGRAKLQQYMT
jgi:hypothetical protein